MIGRHVARALIQQQTQLSSRATSQLRSAAASPVLSQRPLGSRLAHAFSTKASPEQDATKRATEAASASTSNNDNNDNKDNENKTEQTKTKDDTEADKSATDDNKQTEEPSTGKGFFSELKEELSKSLPGGTTEKLGNATDAAGDVRGRVTGAASGAATKVRASVEEYFAGDAMSWKDAGRAVFGLKPVDTPKKEKKKKETAEDGEGAAAAAADDKPKESVVWYEATEEGTGKAYYYNAAGETTWDKPENVQKSAEDEAQEWAAKIKAPEPSLIEKQIRELAHEIEALEEQREDAMADKDMALVKKYNGEARDLRKKIEKLSAQANTTAVTTVEHKKGAWEQFSAGLRGSPLMGQLFGMGDKVGATQAAEKARNAAEDVRETLETSQNPIVYGAYSLWDSMFAESEMGEAIREFRKLEPDFSLEKFMKEKVEEEIIPAVLGGFLRGDKAAMAEYCGEAATAATVAAIAERQAAGMTMDHNILAIEDVEIISAKVVDKQGAMILARFMAQQIDCMYDKEGKVVKGADDQVTAVIYAVVLEQEYSEEEEEVQWKVKEFAVLGNVPYM